MLAGVANSGNAVIGLYPRRSWLFVAPISLLDICTASLRVLSWACLGAWFFFVTKPRWQVIQSRLSMPCRCRELSKIYATRDDRGALEDGSQIPRMTGFISTVASKGTISIDGWIRMGLLPVSLR